MKKRDERAMLLGAGVGFFFGLWMANRIGAPFPKELAAQAAIIGGSLVRGEPVTPEQLQAAAKQYQARKPTVFVKAKKSVSATVAKPPRVDARRVEATRAFTREELGDRVSGMMN